MKELEVMVENLLAEVFETITSVTEGIDVLQNMYQYSKRKDLATEFEKRTIKVFKLFATEIQETRKELVEDKRQHPMGLPRYAGRALTAVLKKKRLKSIMRTVNEAQWLKYCQIEEDVRNQYKKLMASLKETVLSHHRRWMSFTSPNISRRFMRSLLTWSTKRPGLLEVNIDRKLLKTLEEAKLWIQMEFRVPAHVDMVLEKHNELLLLYRSVEAVMMDYNRIISALSDQERMLFRELIKECNRKIIPGITKLTWNTDMADVYVSECCVHLEFLQKFVDDYKSCNVEVVKLCEKICDTPLINIPLHDPFMLKELVRVMADYRHSATRQLVDYYNEIFKYLVVVYEGFESYMGSMKTHWLLYVEKMDTLVEEAFRLCVKHSLKRLLEHLMGDGSTGPTPLVVVSTFLKNNKIVFSPTLEQIFAMSKNILPELMVCLKPFPRLIDKFHLHQRNKKIPYAVVIDTDYECRKLQSDIEKEVEVAMSELRQYLKQWDPLREIWETDRDMFMARYEKAKPSPEAFNNDIGKYEEFSVKISQMDTETNARFFVINSQFLKDDVTGHCDQWQTRLCELLFNIVCDQIETFYKYTIENSKEVMIPPKTLHEMVEYTARHRQMKAEVPDKEAEFPQLKEAMFVVWQYIGDAAPPVMQYRYDGISDQWKKYLKTLEEAEEMLNISQDNFRIGLIDDAENFKTQAAELNEKFLLHGPFTSDFDAKGALSMLSGIKAQLEEMKKKQEQLTADLGVFNISLPPNDDLRKLENNLQLLTNVWELTDEWDTAWASYKTGVFWDIKVEDMEITAQTLYKRFTNLVKELREKNWEIVEHSRRRVDAFRRVLPLITDLKNPAMRPRHWDRVRAAMGREFDENSAEFTLELIIDIKMQDFADAIREISVAASAELNIENGLKGIRETWEKMPLDMVAHKDRGVYRLKAVDDLLQTLEENQVLLSAMKSTRYVQPFIQEVDYWERTLSIIMEVLEGILTVQRQYLYLENIFTGEDIRKQMPFETSEFDLLTSEWITITNAMAADGKALTAAAKPKLLDVVNKMNDKMENIQRALEQYLETKRHLFPRFYFISNDDLLEILGNSRKPEMVQPHFKKLFDNINKIIMNKSAQGKIEGLAMQSADGEVVDFTTPVCLEGAVELWLCAIEEAMRLSLRSLLKTVRLSLKKNLNDRDKWIKEWCGQLCITASQIQWTSDCTRTLRVCKAMENKSALKKLKKKQNAILAKFSDAVRSNLTKIQRLKVNALVTIEIHARDVIESMYKKNCTDVSAFEWMSQLRFYWHQDIDDCIVRQTNTSFVYGYEYLGNSGRLVITPLTDRCYITLTTALSLYRGGSPKGPAGTGKTETVKDLGKALAYYVIVINCSEGLDYKSMGRNFSGFAQTGAWGCFDEFNRINIEVLSVVAQQILSILSALQQGLKKFPFMGTLINLVPTCGIFITMNPGYAGRTELPDNLKSMFRPISMMVPDSMLIADILLFGEGFRDTRNLAKKVYTLFSLARQQLSKQDHYDFGLRGMVALLRYAGRKRRQHPNLPDEEVVLLAMKDMNLAKLTSDDLPLFNGITGDLFPGVVLFPIDYSVMITAIKQEMQEQSLQVTTFTLNKVIQLYETKTSRHSVMIVGRTGAAKSATWKVLQGTMGKLKAQGVPGYEAVSEYPINPKALSLGELYGEYNLATSEWSDGVISAIMRKTCADESSDEKWILFDGPVDAVWIENMNSVMDDNKVLTLINSERITMPEQVSLLFEVEDLAVASPATVSRCGMIFNDYKDFGWEPYVSSWLNSCANKVYVTTMRKHFDMYVQPMLDFVRVHCDQVVPIPELSAVASLCKLLSVLTTEQNGFVKEPTDIPAYEFYSKLWFLFCMIWSLCAGVNEAGRRKVDTYIRELEGVFPLKDTVYEYYVDVRSQSFVSWETDLPANWKYNPELPFFKILVPTLDSVRYEYLTSKLLTAGHPVMLTGIVGTGKTSTAQSVLAKLDCDRYSLLSINMSAQTTSVNVQDFIESRVEKRTKGVYVPFGGKTMITYMDDFNMPAKETYGSQPPLELIRQWIDYGFWYDRQKQIQKFIKGMLLLGSMGPPGGGRNQITNRLLSRFCTVNLTFPAESQIVRIYGTMLSQHLQFFDELVKPAGDELTLMTIDLYNNVVHKMLPTPAKMHYLFNLRDISKIFQGLLRSNKENINTKVSFFRLWIHECFRVFSDRLIDERDRDWFKNEINNQLGKHFDTTFSNICPSKSSPVFCDFMNQYGLYEDVPDMNVLRTFIEKQMKEYNASPGVVRLDLVLFRDAVEHICRIVRVISQPRGNVLLVGMGGSGRQSLARLAAWLAQLTTYQVEITKNYRTAEFKEDLKSLYHATGVRDAPTSFLFNDTQIAEESFLEIINNVLSSGEIANLFKNEEFDEIRNTLNDIAKKQGIVPTAESIYSFFIERVRSNLHIVLCMSPIGDAFRVRLRQYPALINYMTIDWFVEWPKEALLEVASKFLLDVDMLATITGEPREYDEKQYVGTTKQEVQQLSVALIFSTIHDSVTKFSQTMLMEMKRHNYVTPTNYLELVTGYKQILADKRVEVANAANKLRNGLFKIDETKVKVQEMSVELEKATVQVNKMNAECEEFLTKITAQKKEADEQQKSVAATTVLIREEEAECLKIKDSAEADLQEAMPALQEAMEALEALNKKDITEVRSYGRPPSKVELVMEAVMILKQVEPTWAEAKRQLGDVNFLNQLRDFDKDHISEKTLKKIAAYTTHEDFKPEIVGVVSTAAKSLCQWVLAIEKYAKVYKVVAPKKARLDEAMASLKAKQNALASAQAKVAELQAILDKLKADFDEKLLVKEELREKAELLALKLERAGQLVGGLSGERTRWEETVARLDQQFDYLPGDCLLGTAYISYMGPFVSLYREQLLKVWSDAVAETEVPVSPGFNVVEFLSDPTTIREWNIQGLPTDSFSTENGIIISRGSRWPLIIDPQCQAWKWIRNMEGPNNLQLVDFGTTGYMKVVEMALQGGWPVLLQNVMEVLDPSVMPILNKAIVQQAGEWFIKLADRTVPYNRNFRFFITTKLNNPHYPPEISTKTTLVNFAIKEEGLEAQLLGIVVRKEKPQLEEQKDSLVLNIAEGKRTLINLEDELLRLLSESKGSLLDNIELLTTLQTSQATSAAIKEQLETSVVTEVEIDSAREGYRPCAKRASILFFVLTDMARIDPMYQFSLDSYINIFLMSIDKSKKTEVLEDRIINLNEYHTYAVYRNTCRGLFENHKLLFSFHMCIRILDADGKINLQEYLFMLKGGVVLNRDEQPDNPCPGWLPDAAWDNITELDKLGGFHGVCDSLEQFPRDWREWYLAEEPETLPLIGEWQDICNEFQRMLFVRCLREDRLSFCISSFITSYLGPKFTEPPVLDVKTVLDDSSARVPLIFVLSPGVDPTGALISLAEANSMSDRFFSLSLGQGQAPVATKLIEKGMEDGDWIFLANCHLSLSWMPSLDKIVENLQSGEPHKDFRLWLSSSPHPDFPISILQTSIKMTTEPPKGIRANMKRLYNLITEPQFAVCQNQVKYKRLLFSLCFFHSVLLERKKFQQLGWNVIYSFNDSDFDVSENLLTVYLDEYPETPWDALKYLIAGVNYGGHVTDDWDRRLLTTYINQYFNEGVLTTPFYRLSSLPKYYVPREGSLQSYKDYIVTLPGVDQPQVFGQHPNADITSLITETRQLCLTLLSLQVQAAGAQEADKENSVMTLATEVLTRIPEPIDYETTEKLIGTKKTPLDVVLLQEICRYNSLLVTMRDSLEELQKGIQGLVVMSSTLEEIFNCMFEGRVPSAWLKAYPSLKPLGSWTLDLAMRVEHFATWAATTHPPLLFWLAAYTFPTGFLTAVLQTSARQLGISIDLLGWDFTPQALSEREIQLAPTEGVYVRGMFLESAGWDQKKLCLCDPSPLQLVSPMPVVLFKPCEVNKKKSKGLYTCPVYYYPLRAGTQGREAFVVAVDLKSGADDADHWIKRGTALLLSLTS
ncbi:dynein axonemal heavy chain 2 [Macrosteles quadrilineatus]|uniref:dynein axonemal heavy chain 2 n=1 Tax=Macrosteles quadrilineatus TaxID=74068 RepID=UPI0023E34070|nr:dynein axonemal heavy chain 2 [Macrosteles quadrilineatus]